MQIREDLPMPNVGPGVRGKYPWREMKVGQCLVFPKEEYDAARRAASIFAARNSGYHFISRTFVEDGETKYGIWCRSAGALHPPYREHMARMCEQYFNIFDELEIGDATMFERIKKPIILRFAQKYKKAHPEWDFKILVHTPKTCALYRMA